MTSSLSPCDEPLRLVQLSDLHLFAEPEGCLLGVNTQASFEQVCALIEQEQQHCLDLILVTGDIAQQPLRATYDRFIHLMQRWSVSYHWIQGNHDLSPVMADLTPNSRFGVEVVSQGNWHLILLDSSEDHEVGGYLSAPTLDELGRVLNTLSPRPTLIALHHNPLPVGSAWLDQHILRNADALWEAIAPYPHIQLILHGHTHQESRHQIGNVSVLGVPSTCVQFKPHSEDFAVDRIAPGYRWLDLYADGQFTTGISRLSELPSGLELQSSGY